MGAETGKEYHENGTKFCNYGIVNTWHNCYLYVSIYYPHVMKIRQYSILSFALVAALQVTTVQAQYISRFAGNGSGAGTAIGGYAGDGGLAADAKLNGCTGVAIDGAGNVYIADKGNNVVRKVDRAGIITTFAGTGALGYGGNGGQATLARLNAPTALATDAAGNVYISDAGNHVVRRVTPAGIISNYAGSVIAGYAGNGDTAYKAKLNSPEALAVDAFGNLYIADGGNNAIRRVDAATHIITTIAGMGLPGMVGDGGPATAARLNGPAGVAVNASGEVFIADVLNHTVRKVNTSGIISSFAGTGAAGSTGDGGAATAAALSYPSGLSIDIYGNVFIADQGNNNIRVVNTAGKIDRVAGTTVGGFDGDGGMATNARLGAPKGVTVDGWGRIYIADHNNHVVRIITNTAAATNVGGAVELKLYPNPASGSFRFNLPTLKETATLYVTDVTGRVVMTQVLNATNQNNAMPCSELAAGTYMVSVATRERLYTAQLVVNH